jgi:predicted ATPase
MITRLILKNFKSVGEQVYEFTPFDLFVGRNNSGKSTVLQALAIWQFCVDEFHRSKRGGSKGIQVVLPNFTALPLPEFNLLWKDRTDRAYPIRDGTKKQEFILITIHVEWQHADAETTGFGVDLRYHSPQTLYAIPVGGWKAFRDCDSTGTMPKVAYVPPFSGLEPAEKWLDVSPIRQQVGKGQPGSVLRNLLLRVCPPAKRGDDGKVPKNYVPPEDWKELSDTLQRWFGVRIHEPRYDSEKDVYITVEYEQKKNRYDIISGGSGFHQALTLLAFLYGYQPTTVLLDEPDAHLHVSLQREILDYFKRKAVERNTQFIIATHAEEFTRGVDASQIVSLLSQEPKRVQSTPAVLRAMSDVKNEELVRLMSSPFVLYVEGQSDERILRAWAEQCGVQAAIEKVCFSAMNGGTKVLMKESADSHFRALQELVPTVRRLMLFDYDSGDTAFHPAANNPVLAEWKRKNIENYLLVPGAWKRAALAALNVTDAPLLGEPVVRRIDEFFTEQNLTLPHGKTWRNVSANVFSVVDGKRILFDDADSLFHRLRSESPTVKLVREQVALNMTAEELHDDVYALMAKIATLTQCSIEG